MRRDFVESKPGPIPQDGTHLRDSSPIEHCQLCAHAPLTKVLSLGYMPPVNQMVSIGEVPREQLWFPTDFMYCDKCDLVQLGIAVDPAIVFPPDYPYTSGTTKLLRDNFADLAAEASSIIGIHPKDLVVDIGSNDGTLLSNFVNQCRVLGVEPTAVAEIAEGRGIPTKRGFFSHGLALDTRHGHGPAHIITMANCFAHIDNLHGVVEGIRELLDRDGVFISESHYLMPLLDRLQYDTIYHEHLRYYSLTSLANLLLMHGLEVFHARPIPSHGGSIRVYAARLGSRPVRKSVTAMLAGEPQSGKEMRAKLQHFAKDVMFAKLKLLWLIYDLKAKGERIVGIGAPSRASTLINYVGLDVPIIDYVCEIDGSLKIGKYMPGTSIPVVNEDRLFADQPECAIIFSWHIADELAPKLRAKGYRGRLIVPLPVPSELEE